MGSIKSFALKRIALVALVLVAGCVTAEKRTARNAANAEREHQECVSYGAQPGTNSYMEYRLSLAQIRAQNDAARTAAWQQGMQNLGQGISNLSPNAYAPPPSTTMSTAIQMGVFLHVNCF